MASGKQSAYAEIASEIRTSILERVYSPGDNLPSENELAKIYNTSRVTVRNALNLLCNEGMIYSHQGKGYFVNSPKYSQYSMDFDLMHSGFQVKHSRITIITPPDEVAAKMNTQKEMIMIRAILYNDQFPVACEDKYLHYEKGVPMIESVMRYADFPELMEKFNSPFELHSELRISAENADEEHARLLCCRMDEPLLMIKRTIKAGADRVIGYGLIYLRSEYGYLTAESGYQRYDRLIYQNSEENALNKEEL